MLRTAGREETSVSGRPGGKCQAIPPRCPTPRQVNLSEVAAPHSTAGEAARVRCKRRRGRQLCANRKAPVSSGRARSSIHHFDTEDRKQMSNTTNTRAPGPEPGKTMVK